MATSKKTHNSPIAVICMTDFNNGRSFITNLVLQARDGVLHVNGNKINVDHSPDVMKHKLFAEYVSTEAETLMSSIRDSLWSLANNVSDSIGDCSLAEFLVEYIAYRLIDGTIKDDLTLFVDSHDSFHALVPNGMTFLGSPNDVEKISEIIISALQVKEGTEMEKKLKIEEKKYD